MKAPLDDCEIQMPTVRVEKIDDRHHCITVTHGDFSTVKIMESPRGVKVENVDAEVLWTDKIKLTATLRKGRERHRESVDWNLRTNEMSGNEFVNLPDIPRSLTSKVIITAVYLAIIALLGKSCNFTDKEEGPRPINPKSTIAQISK